MLITKSTDLFSLAIWIFSLEYSLFLVDSLFYDRIIKILLLIIAILLTLNSKIIIYKKIFIILSLIITLSIFTLFPSIAYGEDGIGIIQWSKIFLPTLVLPLGIIYYKNHANNIENVITLIKVTGLIFSIQALCAFLWVMFVVGLDAQNTLIEIGRRPGTPEYTMGILGYANSVKGIGDNIVWLRPQGWFLEPSLLGGFLMGPLMLYIAQYSTDKKKKNAFFILIISLAIFTTVSIAAYLCTILSLIIYYFSYPTYSFLKNKINIIKRFYLVILILIFLIISFSAIKFINYIAENKIDELSGISLYLGNLYAKDRDSYAESGNLLRQANYLYKFQDLVDESPFGIGFADTASENETLASNAFLFWYVAGGYVAIFIIIIIFTYFYFQFVSPMLLSGNYIFVGLTSVVIAQATHALSYGNWMAPYFLINVMIICLLKEIYVRNNRGC